MDRTAIWMSIYLLIFTCIALAQPPAPQDVLAKPIAQYIQDIEQPRQANLLKTRFLMGERLNQPNLQDDWKTLVSACNLAPTETKSWFLLQGVKATVAYRLPFATPSEGASAYAAIFDHAAQAPQAKAEYVVRSSINDYLFTLTGKMSDLKQRDTPETTATTVKAWKAYLIAQGYTDLFSKRLPRPDWASILEHTGMPEAMGPLVEEELRETKSPSYELLTVASLQASFKDLKRALELFQQAEPLLAHDSMGHLDAHEANLYYDRLIELYQLNKKETEVQEVALRRVRVLDTGRAYLVQSFLDKGDEMSLKKVVDELTQPQANEADIVAVSDLLYHEALKAEQPGAVQPPVLDEKTAQLLISLLHSYLQSERSRTSDGELVARLRLASVYFYQGQKEQARTLIKGAQTPRLESAPSATARRTRSSLTALLKRIDITP